MGKPSLRKKKENYAKLRRQVSELRQTFHEQLRLNTEGASITARRLYNLTGEKGYLLMVIDELAEDITMGRHFSSDMRNRLLQLFNDRKPVLKRTDLIPRYARLVSEGRFGLASALHHIIVLELDI